MGWEVFDRPRPGQNRWKNAERRDRWKGQGGASLKTRYVLDVARMYSELHEFKQSFEPPLSWRQVANRTGVSPSTFTRLNRGHACDTDAFLTLCAWADLDPVRFASERPDWPPTERIA